MARRPTRVLTDEERADLERVQAEGWEQSYEHGPWFSGGLPLLIPDELRWRTIVIHPSEPPSELTTARYWLAGDAGDMLGFVNRHNAKADAADKINILGGYLYAAQGEDAWKQVSHWKSEYGRDAGQAWDEITDAAVEFKGELAVCFMFYMGTEEGMFSGEPQWHRQARLQDEKAQRIQTNVGCVFSCLIPLALLVAASYGLYKLAYWFWSR